MIKLTLSNSVWPAQKLLYKKSRSHGYRPGSTGQPRKHRPSMGTDSNSQTWIYRATPEAQTHHRYRCAHTEQPQNTDTSVFKYKTSFEELLLANSALATETDWVMSPHTKHSLYRGFTGLGWVQKE